MKRYVRTLGAILLLVTTITTGCNVKSKEPIERSINRNVIFEGEDIGGLKKTDLLGKLNSYSYKINIDARDAKLDGETWEIAQKETTGKKINVPKTLEVLFSAGEGQKRQVVVEKVLPRVTSAQLSKNIVLIGSYTTAILDQRDSRTNNIKLASERLDYEKVRVGEEFSFNAILGKRTVRKGYEKAPIIIKTEKGPKKAYGIGGGICQLSSTLFNAVEKAKLNVTERHTHSKAVMYVPKGRDATVAYGSSDFKFINNGNYPVMIRVYLAPTELTVKLFENRNPASSAV